MRPRRLSEIASVVDGEVLGEDVLITSVATDSRQLDVGALFVAIEAGRRDGHAFVPAAFDRGASAALVRRGTAVEGPAVEVAETGAALLALGADERSAMRALVVGITGANGKTSTKDMTAAVSGARFRTHASPASFNNEIGHADDAPRGAAGYGGRGGGAGRSPRAATSRCCAAWPVRTSSS